MITDVSIVYGEPTPVSLNDYINSVTDSDGNDLAQDFRLRVCELEYLREGEPLQVNRKNIHFVLMFIVRDKYDLTITEDTINHFTYNLFVDYEKEKQ